jgi:hypothetical protein
MANFLPFQQDAWFSVVNEPSEEESIRIDDPGRADEEGGMAVLADLGPLGARAARQRIASAHPTRQSSASAYPARWRIASAHHTPMVERLGNGET